MMKRLRLLMLFLLIALLASSCWSRREIEDLGFVMGMGISKTDTGLYSVVVQIANPNAIVAENADAREAYSIAKSEGLTVFDAIRNLSMVAKRRLYIGHIKTLIIDESIAREGIGRVVSFLVQDMEVRLEMEVYISKIPPEQILDTPNYLGIIPAMGISIIAENIGANDKIYVSDLHETVEAVNNPVINYVTTLIEKIPAPSEHELPELRLSQIAVFEDDVLKGYLDHNEGQAFNFITNNFFNGLITMVEAVNNDKVVIEVLQSKTRITPDYKDGRVHFDIHLEVMGNIAERIVKEETTHVLDPKLVQKQLDQTIAKMLYQSIHNAQENFEIDYYNLSAHFSRKYPSVFREIKEDWNSVFANAKISVKVESTVRHSALNLNRGRI